MSVNTAGADWLQIKAWIDAEIERLRDELEQDQQPYMTYAKRGEIAVLRRLVEFANPKEAPQVEDVNYDR